MARSRLFPCPGAPAMLSTLPLLLALASAPTAAAPAQDPAQQVARRAVQQGRYVPLEGVVRDALQRYPGQLLEVELDDGVYEVEILRSDGVVVELDYDARNGKLLKTELDD
nr:PepSY domain-containing protein [uncultured Stenotrophomonas sp.]